MGEETKFCYWQLPTKEYPLTCTAHLCEGRAFECPYKAEEIFEQDGQRGIAHRGEEGKLVGVCEDFI